MPKMFVITGLMILLLAGGISIYIFVDDYRAGYRAQQLLEQIQVSPAHSVNISADVLPAASMEPTLPVTDYVQESLAVINTDSAAVSLEEDSSVSLDEDSSELLYDTIGIISIPKFGISLPVLSECSVSLLKVSVCRYTGSVPDKPERLVVAGHNYKTHFGKLPKLQSGDEVCFTNAEGIQYLYTVSEISEISMNDHATLEAGEWDMTLFTCNANGKRRILVRCIEKM